MIRTEKEKERLREIVKRGIVNAEKREKRKQFFKGYRRRKGKK